MLGTIIFFDRIRSFGFLVPDDGSADLFFHRQSIVASGKPQGRYVVKGDRVSFEIAKNPRRDNEPMAVTVTHLAKSQPPNGLTLAESVQKDLAAILGGGK